MRKILSSGLSFLWITVLIILADRFSKAWIIAHLIPFEPLKILPFFNLTLAYNTGAAFSFLHSASGWQNVLLGSFAGIVSVIILFWLAKLSARDWLMNIALCLVLGGALSNALDRILYGYVIDFFDFHLGDWHFAIFNIADSAICVGAFMMLFYWLRNAK